MAASVTYSPVKVGVIIIIIIIIIVAIVVVIVICSVNYCFSSDRLKIEGSNVINMDIPATNGVIQANDDNAMMLLITIMTTW